MAEEDIVGRMVEAYAGEVYRCCLGMLRDRQLAEDASQETFLRALRRLPGFRRESHERTWLLAIAMNVCRDVLRKPYHRRVRPVADVVVESGQEPLRRMEEHDALVAAVQALPEKQRAAVLLHYYHDLSVPEVARMLRVSRGTVSSHLTRARRALSRQLSEEGGACNETQCAL